MKKALFLMTGLFALTVMINAQPGGGFQRRTPEERAAVIHAKLDSAFTIEASRLAVLDTALAILYKQQDEKMREMFSSGERPDRETMMAEMQKYTDARDAMIKQILTAEQFTIWKEKIEPAMRPQRDAGGGGMRNGN